MTDPQEPPQLADADVRRDLAAYWPVYQRFHDTARDASLDGLRDDPDLAPMVESLQGDERLLGEMDSLATRAFEEGDWAPYLARLRDLGATYAQKGLDFALWVRLTTAYRRHLTHRIVEAYQNDPDQLTAAIRGESAFFDVLLQTIGDAYLHTREQTIAKQRTAISELSTPVLQIRPGLLLIPIVGVIDTTRSRQLTEALLRAIRDNRAGAIVMDITGVPEVDSEVANRLVQAAEASRLMGATPVLTGISAGVAQTLVSLGVDLKGLRTVGDLQSGIDAADALLGYRVVTERPANADEQ